MKKYLFIYLSLISLTSFSEIDYTAFLQNINRAVSYIATDISEVNDGLTSYLFSDQYKDLLEKLDDFFSSDPENGYDVSLKDLLYHAFNEPDLPSIPRMLTDIVDYNLFFLPYLESINDYIYNVLPEYLYNLSPSDILFYLQDGNVADNIQSIDDSLRNLEEIKISVNQLGDKYDQIIVNGNNTSDDLQTIIAELQKLNGGSDSDLPQVEIGYYPLNSFGKDVDINNLSLLTFETTGEYNKDVHQLLINLNHIGSSQNNAALSILTNVQVIATLLSEDAEGKEKVEKDLEDREYQATKAEAELGTITSESWDGSFTPPRSVSEVYANLSISASDPGLPSKITVMDRFYYETQYINLTIDEMSFDIPQGLIDLADYARIVFGFVYWSLTLLLAIFIFRLWMKLYSVVTQNFVSA